MSDVTSGVLMPDMSMCSASQPWLLAMALPSLRARHFLPSREFPPYPDPKLKISSVSGLWAMISLSGLHGHSTLGEKSYVYVT